MMVYYTTQKYINCILHKTIKFLTKLLLYSGYIWFYNIEHTWLNRKILTSNLKWLD
jgi:hypothetical protein